MLMLMKCNALKETKHLRCYTPSLLDAGVANMLQLLAACMHVRSGGGTSRDSPLAVGVGRAAQARVGGRGMQVRGGRWSAGAGIRTSGR
jgi:hypothetical protein